MAWVPLLPEHIKAHFLRAITHKPNNRFRLLDCVMEHDVSLQRSDVEQRLALSFPALTSRQLTIGALVCKDVNSKSIADLLGVATRTVENHRYRLRRQLGLRNGESLRTIMLLSMAKR